MNHVVALVTGLFTYFSAHRLSGSKPLRQATPGSLARRRQRQLSGRRAHALRARRTGDSSSGESAAVSGRRQRGRRRAGVAGMLDTKEVLTQRSSSKNGEVDGMRDSKTGHLTRDGEIELCTAVQVRFWRS